MAHQVAGRTLWSRKNEQEQGLLISHPRYSDIINNKRPNLVSTIQPASLWPHLRKYYAVGERLQDKMTLNSTRAETVEKLLDHVERGPMWQLHSLFRACNLTDQSHIIREVGLDPEVYAGPSPPESDSEDESHCALDEGAQRGLPSPQNLDGATSVKHPTRTFNHPLIGQNVGPCIQDHQEQRRQKQQQLPQQQQNQREQCEQKRQQTSQLQEERQDFIQALKAAVKSHRDVYNRTLMRGRLFDIPSLDLPYDMEWCYIQIVATSDELLRNPVDILPADILKAKQGKPKLKTVLLSGHPGSGKSAFIRFYGHRWSQMKAGESEWDLIIIINVSTLKLTDGRSPKELIKEAIAQSLEGGVDKEAIIKILDDPKFNILIIPDGMDECRNPTTLNMLIELITGCYKGELNLTVLATCRTGLCPVNESLFDKRLKIDGFKTHEGVEYVNRFYNHIQKPGDESVFDYIANNQEDLDHILTNPLCTHILSVVTADGTLKLTKGHRLRLKELFLAMEKSMRRRQIEKLMLEGSEHDILEEDHLKEDIKFYNMSLWSLLNDVRTIDRDLMDTFGISTQHPHLTFMTKTKKYNFKFQDISYWRFNHEMFHEYFAASALAALPEDQCLAILLTISSDKKFRNTQRILFSALGGDFEHLGKLTDMVRVNLIMQGEWFGSDDRAKQIIQDMKDDIQSKGCGMLADLLDTLKSGQKDEMNVWGLDSTNYAPTVWHSVKSLFDYGAKGLQRCGLQHDTGTVEMNNSELINLREQGMFQTDSSNILGHISELLHELPEEHQQLVLAGSLDRTMPTTGVYQGKRCIFYGTGERRWVKITEERSSVKILIKHSLTDASKAVQQYGQQHLITWMQENHSREIAIVHLDMEFRRNGPDVSREWGDPKYDQFLSPELWSKLLCDISAWPVTANGLYLEFERDSVNGRGVLGFLQCLQMRCIKVALQKLLLEDGEDWVKITVESGYIDSNHLLDWMNWYVNQDLFQVELVLLECHITGKTSAFRQRQRQRIQSFRNLKHNGHRGFQRMSIVQDLETMAPEVPDLPTSSADGDGFALAECSDDSVHCCRSCTLI